jgi:hypothetical protein
MKILLILVLCLASLFYPIYGWGACSWNGNTGTVSSPYGASDVQACIADASSKTGQVIIQIPNSTVTWSSGITVNMSSGFSNVNRLTIKGQNDCFVDGNDIPTACGTNVAKFYLNYTGKEGKAFRLAHLRTAGTSGVRIDGDGKSWRIDHIFWDTVTGYTSARLIWIAKGNTGWLTEGLIDHNYVLNPVGGSFVHSQPAVDGGNLEWMTGVQLGTSHAVYLENNKIVQSAGGKYLTDNNGASRWVIRYNEINDTYVAGHDPSTGGFRGALKAEIYNNTFNLVKSGNCFVLYRGGAVGVFFNNTINDSFGGCPTIYIELTTYRNSSAQGWPAACSNTSGKMYLATSTTYPASCSSGAGCINTDGSASSPSGYPCRDQIGVSGNDQQVGGGQPFLFWNNTYNGSDITVSVGVDSSSYIVSGRDYCKHATTMPTTCNSIVQTYTPYTYPHPLIEFWDNPGPSPPANLRISN